jgi:hypothetical protein
MKQFFSVICALFFLTGVANADASKFEQEKALIKSMAGCYKVTFDFAETFAPDSNYKYHDRKHEWAIEYVFIVEETDKKVSLQHLLLVGGGMVIKHWRQDWVYENASLLMFDRDNKWKKVTIDPKKVKGTWTQKVFNVDDSPRYEGFGTWNHVDGRNFWESATDAPLPRREYTTRSDYNVVVRHSKVEINKDGWFLEQDNDKVIRADAGDKLLASEKGFERFTHDATADCKTGEDWWTKHKNFWNDARAVWAEIYAKPTNLNLKAEVDSSKLYEKLFAADDKFSDAPKYDSDAAKAEIRKIIDSFTNK